MIGEIRLIWTNAPRLRGRMVAMAAVLTSLTILALASYRLLLGWEPWLIIAAIGVYWWGIR